VGRTNNLAWISFEEAHRRTCVRRNTLAVSCAQIEFDRFEIPRRRYAMPWRQSEGPVSGGGEEGDSPTTLEFLSKYSEALGWDPPAVVESSSSSSLVAWLSRRLSRGSSGGVIADTSGRENTVAAVASSSSAVAYVQPDDPILCESLALECLRMLEKRVRDSPTSDRNPSRAWTIHGSDEFSLRTWLLGERESLSLVRVVPGGDDPRSEGGGSTNDRTVTTGEFVASLPASQLLWLLRLLQHGKMVQIVTPRRENRPDGAVVLLPQPSAQPPERQNEMNHCLAVLDLLRTKSQLERMEERANDQRDQLQRRALEMLRSKRRGAAVAVQQRSKLYEREADRAVKALLNVEHALNLIESSVANSQIVAALKQANEALKSQRVDLEQLDSVLEDMTENVELDRQFQDTLTSAQRSSLLPVDALDDDALLGELMRSLTLDESATSAEGVPAASVPPAAPAALLVSVGTNTALPDPLPASFTQRESESSTSICVGKVASPTTGEMISS
jgi:hypothetical protein